MQGLLLRLRGRGHRAVLLSGTSGTAHQPGGESTDFGYDADGALTQVRAPLTNDLVAAGRIPDSAADRHKTLIAYTAPAGPGEAKKVASVTAPVATRP